jgi:hypothetical protein
MPAPSRGEVWIVDRLHPGQVMTTQAVTYVSRPSSELIPNFRGMSRAVAAFLY